MKEKIYLLSWNIECRCKYICKYIHLSTTCCSIESFSRRILKDRWKISRWSMKFPFRSSLRASWSTRINIKNKFPSSPAWWAYGKAQDEVHGAWVWPDGRSPRIDRDPGRFLRGHLNDRLSVFRYTHTNV